jgi:hypothetical protein
LIFEQADIQFNIGISQVLFAKRGYEDIQSKYDQLAHLLHCEKAHEWEAYSLTVWKHMSVE